ncbi:serine/threonine-protein kinase [Ornithinimicrobium sufpigmenti]|uniref:serine/threonine-protein kinase n=1 Tax=Ornithinimicrobium sufpigmenti TaxID=2508882 RepID=UPI0015E1611D|nr:MULTISPECIES: serine/threonine-protein kinase [unclassified Ornithinimicrobium]
MSDQQDPDDLATTSETPVGEDPGLVAGRYRIRRTLGKGGGGHVWLAHDEKLGREVTLKRVSGEADTEVLLTRGFREARTSATLAHENVVRVYDAFEHDGSPWIVMEYIPGPSLAELLEGDRRLPVDQVATIGAQLATALAAAHGAGILHRDVKPGNVLLRDERGRDAKLTDFGIARAEEDHQLTRTGFVSGTAAYFSPELARGEDPSPAADVWALGATLYYALEGRKPFPDRPNAVAQLHTIARDLPRPPEHAGPLTAVLAGMLDPDPDTRWDAARSARELEAVARGGRGPTTWPGGGAGSAAAAAVAARHGGPSQGARRQTPDAVARAPHVPHEPTQAVPPADSTRAIPRSRPRHGSPEPARSGQPPRSAGAARSDGYGPGGPARPGEGAAYHRTAGQRRPRRTAMWLGWLLVVPLLAALGWLVWTITEDVRAGDGAGTTSSGTAAQTAAVGSEEAQELAEEFYDRLLTEGLASARELTTEAAYIDAGIADNLSSVDVEGLEAVENPDGTATVTARVTYSYGQNVFVQDETLRVDRVDEVPLIVSRDAPPAADR